MMDTGTRLRVEGQNVKTPCFAETPRRLLFGRERSGPKPCDSEPLPLLPSTQVPDDGAVKGSAGRQSLKSRNFLSI